MGRTTTSVNRQELYEFLYERDYEAWFCNLAKQQFYDHEFKDFLLKIHTGESFCSVTKEWNIEQRKKLGQEYLKYLAESYLCWYEGIEPYSKQRNKHYYEPLMRSIELDGYRWMNNTLVQQEYDITDVDEQKGILDSLYVKLKLDRRSDASEFLALAELHYVEGRWSDCISNSRKYFELVFYEVAKQLAAIEKDDFDNTIFERPVEVRKYLEEKKILERKEREAVDKIYGLLSHTGGHPYMAESDQARLLRQISLLFTQFIMLRLVGKLT